MKLSDIKRIGIAGGGTMGFGIGTNFALWGYPVVIYDLNDRILAKTRQRIEKALKIFLDEGMISEKKAGETSRRIRLTDDIARLGETDFITEAIVERLSDKQEIFNKLDKLCPPQTIIVSNTSSLVLSDIARDVKRQDKVALTHYFDPPHIVPGVEVAKGPGTSDETFNITYDLMAKVKKVPVKVLREQSGYLLNSIQYAMAAEAQKLWAEGFASAEDIERGITATFGFRSPHEGPMMHNDLAGIWKWPRDVLGKRAERILSAKGLSEAAKAKLVAQIISGKPWFVDPEHFEEAVEARDREYARRLKDLYWGKIE
jgi:3-hydroxybutyryl-CoA dehydrogenase